MKRTFLAAIMVFISLTLAACGGETSSAPATIITQIFSDPAFDGDIAEVPLTGTFTVTQGFTQSVFAGIDPVSFTEFRAFLDFPLTGANGVPGNAIIASATLDIVINSITPPSGAVPLRIDLVSFQPPTLLGTDFDRTIQPALATTTFTILPTDFGNHVFIDMGSLMTVAQNLGLANFQIRILEELGDVTPGLIEINDTTGANQAALAPLLQVEYL